MPSDDITADDLLLGRFIASFEQPDDLVADEVSGSIAGELATFARVSYGRRPRRPVKVRTEFSSLEPIYARLPARFPPLFERLVLSYRWAEVDLRFYRLLANPPGCLLDGLLREMSRDATLWECLLRAGYIQFGKGPDVDYDPVCFDISSRKKNRDCTVVKIDHEQILCHDRIVIAAELAPSFEELMLRTIESASGTPL